MERLKRYGPLAGTGILASVVVLRLLGYEEIATTLQSLGVGFTGDAAVGYGELAAAGAGIAGVVLKVRSEWRKAHA